MNIWLGSESTARIRKKMFSRRKKTTTGRYSSVMFPSDCYRTVITARNKLPQEAGFIWWFRFNYSLSSTIWNQCSWRKNACFHQWNRALETSVEKKRGSGSSLPLHLAPLLAWDCRVGGLGDSWESDAVIDANLPVAFAGGETEKGVGDINGAKK